MALILLMPRLSAALFHKSTVPLFLKNSSVTDDRRPMAGGAAHRAKVTDEHREEARLLKSIWQREPRPTQAEFGEIYGIGGQSAVANFLNGTSALSLRAGIAFAKGLECSLSDFSPRLAEQVASHEAVRGGSGPTYQEPASPQRVVSFAVPSPNAITFAMALEALGDAIEAAPPEARAGAVVLLKTYLDNPRDNKDMLPIIAKRLSGEFGEAKAKVASGRR